MTRDDLKEVLSYALGGSAPERFVERLVGRRESWDSEFVSRLEALAYELRPDLAMWELDVDFAGRLLERRVPLLEPEY